MGTNPDNTAQIVLAVIVLLSCVACYFIWLTGDRHGYKRRQREEELEGKRRE